MRLCTEEEIKWLQFDLFGGIPGLTHGVFLRHGGESEGSLGSLNVSFSVGDDPRIVEKNRARIASWLQLSHLEALCQVHGKKILKEKGEGDGLMTSRLNVGLLIQHADCQAALFYDPIHHVVANVHAGWRGLVADIYGETVRALRENYDSRPEDLLVGIAPSLGPDHAEFLHYKQEFPPSFWDFNRGDHHFNLWEIGRMQLQTAGVLLHHIEIAEICTYANSEDWFSFRRSRGVPTGRHATVIGIIPSFVSES